LEDVPEEMYGGALARAKGRKSKRKLTAEEYLEAEKPAKKAKVASDKLKIGGSTVPSIEEVVEDLDSSLVLNVGIAPIQPAIPKKKRKPAVRRIKDFPHVVKQAEATTAAPGVVDATKEVLELATELQEISMSEASQLLKVPVTTKADQKRTADCSEASTTGTVPSHTEPVIHEISSNSTSISLETSSSSSDSDDDKPLGHRYPKLIKGQSTSTKTHKKPSQTSSYEPVGHIINQKLEEIFERRNQVIDRILLHHPQPLNIQPLNMIVPDNVESNSQKASEMAPEASASEKDISESPQQQQPKQQKTPSPQQQPTNAPAEPQMTTPTSPKPTVPEPTVPEQTVSKPNVPEPTVPEHITTELVAPEQPVLEPTPSTITHLHVQVIKITRYDGVSDMDLDSEDDQDDHASHMNTDIIFDQPLTSQPSTTNGQSTTNLAIVPTAPPKPSNPPSPPTIFLDSQVLQDVWEDIASEALKLIKGRNDLGHSISYQKQWIRLKERVVNVISALHDSCIEAQKQAKQKLED
jgi:hypothetical protein